MIIREAKDVDAPDLKVLYFDFDKISAERRTGYECLGTTFDEV